MNQYLEHIMQYLPDELFIQMKYYHHFGRFANLKHPETFNEKIQWLKLHDRKPEYIKMVDKAEAKKYIASLVGEQYVIPTIALYDCFDDIDFGVLPERFVIKATHDSGGVLVCKDKAKLDISTARAFFNKHLKRNYFFEGREWPYKHVKPRILIEQYLENAATSDLKDYKFFAFDGVVKALFVAADRQSEMEETKFDFYDADFKHLNIRNGHPNAGNVLKKPAEFELMKSIASKLSKGIPHLRVDFYEVNGKVYVGELTFSHYSGFIPFEPPKWDKIFGDWLKLEFDE